LEVGFSLESLFSFRYYESVNKALAFFFYIFTKLMT